MTAKRFNAGKIDFTLIPVDAEEEEARVWMAGEVKYGRDNWTKLWGEDTVIEVMKSMQRHVNAIRRGEMLDAETGCQHAAHIRCNAAMLIRWYNQQTTLTSSPETKRPSHDRMSAQEVVVARQSARRR